MDDPPSYFDDDGDEPERFNWRPVITWSAVVLFAAWNFFGFVCGWASINDRSYVNSVTMMNTASCPKGAFCYGAQGVCITYGQPHNRVEEIIYKAPAFALARWLFEPLSTDIPTCK